MVLLPISLHNFKADKIQSDTTAFAECHQSGGDTSPRPSRRVAKASITRENRIFRRKAKGDEKYSIFGDPVYQTLILYAVVAWTTFRSKNNYFSLFSDPSVEGRNFPLNQKYLHIKKEEHRYGSPVCESFCNIL